MRTGFVIHSLLFPQFTELSLAHNKYLLSEGSNYEKIGKIQKLKRRRKERASVLPPPYTIFLNEISLLMHHTPYNL